MSKEALEDIIIKSLEDAAGCLAKGEQKPHFLVNDDDARDYFILLSKYYKLQDDEDAFVIRNYCRDVHRYLMDITGGGKKQIFISGASTFKSLNDYEKQESPELCTGDESFYSSKDKSIEYIKNASLGTAIACTGFYATTQNLMALMIGIPALGIQAVSRLYIHFITRKKEKKKGELMALNAFLEETDFMLVKDILDENKAKVMEYIEKPYISPV